MPTTHKATNPAHVRFTTSDIRKLDTTGTGLVTPAGLKGAPQCLRGTTSDGDVRDVWITDEPKKAGLGAHLFDYARTATGPSVDVPASVLESGSCDRALLAADSYGLTFRTMRIPDVLDAVIKNADPKLGVLDGGLFDKETGKARVYDVVDPKTGGITKRKATYDGKKAFLYVPATEPEAFAHLQRAVRENPERYGKVEVRSISEEELGSHEVRMQLKYDAPGVMWVSSRSPAVPHLQDDGYIVPGGRFGIELYYHDTRINIPSAGSTVRALTAAGNDDEASHVLSIMRGTVSSLCNEVLHYGKIYNATLTPNAGRSQAPCLTNGILETYNTWVEVKPQEKADAKKWLAWATRAAEKELKQVWLNAPRFDPETGLSRYQDESPSVAPEEDPEFYEGLDFDAQGIVHDASVREHGWDSMTTAVLTAGPDKGKPRVHWFLTPDLNALLFRYEKDLATAYRLIEDDEQSPTAAQYEAKANARKERVDQLLWNKDTGLYTDLVKKPGEPVESGWQNNNDDLRAFTPLWAGMVEKGSEQAKGLARRIRDFMRPGGIATATNETWDALHALFPAYAERCQWANKDVGWPITTYETVKGLRSIGEDDLANEIAYRWCFMVENVMENKGGVHTSKAGGYEAPIFEKMNVTESSARVDPPCGYGNQGGNDHGEGFGFRWGLDSYKLNFRELPQHLQESLRRGASPEVVFDARTMLAGRTPKPHFDTRTPSVEPAHVRRK
jgi:alpha,alpha-trehalase